MDKVLQEGSYVSMAGKKSNSTASVSPSNLVSRDEALAYYRDMLLIRRFEERAGQLYGMGLIAGFCHLYIGQEAGRSGHYRLSRSRAYVGMRHECA